MVKVHRMSQDAALIDVREASAPSLPACPFSFIELSELDPAFRADPHARLRSLRNQCPVSHDAQMGRVILTRHGDARAVLDDRSFYREVATKAAPGNPMRQAMMAQAAALAGDDPANSDRRPTMLFLDDPHHGRIRSLFLRHFQVRMSRFRPTVDGIVTEALQALPLPVFDVIADYAHHIPLRVIAALLGVAPDDYAAFRRWGEAALALLNPLAAPAERAAGREGMMSLRRLGHRLLDERRAAPGDDFVSDIAAEQARGYDISDAEIVDNLILLLTAGHLTTTDLIGSGINLLLRHPAELAKLRGRPELIGSAVEEMLRCEPPAMNTARVATEPHEVSGYTLPGGEVLVASIAAANRDPDVFDHPDRFDIERKRNRHISFGGGAHMCLGAALARIEGQSAVLGLVQRFPELRLEQPEAEPEWRATPFFRGLKELRVRVD